MKHFDANNILSDAQHGFRYKRSCESQLVITVQEIVKRLAKGSQVDISLLDFAKAFDKVPHARLYSQDRLYLKPCCASDKMLLASKCFIMLLCMICSINTFRNSTFCGWHQLIPSHKWDYRQPTITGRPNRTAKLGK
jgi:hypothetical protein